jgi:hypothetical protein
MFVNNCRTNGLYRLDILDFPAARIYGDIVYTVCPAAVAGGHRVTEILQHTRGIRGARAAGSTEASRKHQSRAKRSTNVNQVILRVLQALGVWIGATKAGSQDRDTQLALQRAEDSGRGRTPLYGVLISNDSNGSRRG